MNLQEFLQDKFLKSVYKINKQEFIKIVDEVDKDKLIRSRIAQTMLLKHFEDVNKHIQSNNLFDEVDGMEYIQFESEVVIMSNLDTYKLMHYLCSLPQREATNLAARLESFIEMEEKKFEKD